MHLPRGSVTTDTSDGSPKVVAGRCLCREIPQGGCWSRCLRFRRSEIRHQEHHPICLEHVNQPIPSQLSQGCKTAA